MKIPGPDHPITIARNTNRVVVTVDGKPIAETTRALTLREADYPPVHYIPIEDVDTSRLERTAHSTYCPFKGNASYYDFKREVGGLENTVWVYETPYPAVAAIAGHLAFYPAKVDSIEELPAAS